MTDLLQALAALALASALSVATLLAFEPQPQPKSTCYSKYHTDTECEACDHLPIQPIQKGIQP